MSPQTGDRHIIRGIVPPLATPFTGAEMVDERGLRTEVRYLVACAGVHGLAIGGSTGEGHTLTMGELRQIVGAAIDEAGGQIPVIAGIIVNSTRQAIETGFALSDLEVAAPSGDARSLPLQTHRRYDVPPLRLDCR